MHHVLHLQIFGIIPQGNNLIELCSHTSHDRVDPGQVSSTDLTGLHYVPPQVTSIV